MEIIKSFAIFGWFSLRQAKHGLVIESIFDVQFFLANTISVVKK